MKEPAIPLTRLIADCCKSWSTKPLQPADSREILGIFQFPDDFPAFAGHFPGKPVLPAIVQLASVSCLAGLALGTDIRAQQYSKAKFRAMIQPGDEIHLTLRMDGSGSLRTGTFSLRQKSGELVSSGSVHF